MIREQQPLVTKKRSRSAQSGNCTEDGRVAESSWYSDKAVPAKLYALSESKPQCLIHDIDGVINIIHRDCCAYVLIGTRLY